MMITEIRYERRVNTHDYDNTVFSATAQLGSDDHVMPSAAMDLLREFVLQAARRDFAQRWPGAGEREYKISDPDIFPASHPAPPGES